MNFRSTCLACASFGVIALAGAPLAADPVIKKVEVNGATMTYVDEGAGEPILFVHGAVSDLRAWEPIRGEIADEHRFIAITLRYFGTGDWDWSNNDKPFNVATHADDVAAFIKALDVGPVHLVGWSYGANVATTAALANPDLVQSLILFEPPLSSLIKEGEAGDAAREAERKMFRPVTAAVNHDVKKATRLLIEGVFQMPPGGFENQPQELQGDATR